MTSLIVAGACLLAGVFSPLLVRHRETDSWLIFIIRRFLPIAFFGVAFGIFVTWLITR